MNDPYQWRTLYATAMLEGDQTQVRPRIEKAQEAIHARMRELPQKFFIGSEQRGLLLAHCSRGGEGSRGEMENLAGSGAI